MNLKKIERYLRINLFWSGPSSYEKKNLPGRSLTKIEKTKKRWYNAPAMLTAGNIVDAFYHKL